MTALVVGQSPGPWPRTSGGRGTAASADGPHSPPRTRGYRENSGIERQRQLGFEIGLNLQQILFDLKVSRGTWWGYALHVVGDNVRLPFTAIEMRIDLNRGKWHGPNSGNYD